MSNETLKHDSNFYPVAGAVTNDADQDIRQLRVNSSDELLVAPQLPGLQIPAYDYVNMALSAGDTTETYTFKTGGSGGVEVAIVTVVYTDSTRQVLVSVTKT